jgi:hypothetical protein
MACAPLRSAPLPEIGPPEFARVVSKRQLEIRSGETRAERAAWAMLSLDPITVASAVLGVEDNFGRSQVNEYDLALVSGRSATVRSRYVVEPGQCIVMRRSSDYVVIIAQDDARCAEAPGSAVETPGNETSH